MTKVTAERSAPTQPKKVKQPLWHILAMCFGFFGIQHAFSIQFANMSVIYERLGVNPENIPFLWLAAPLTGLLVTPVVGYMSDRTWGPLGRRRPYFLVGAVLAALAMVAIPNCPNVWWAACSLFVLDASINTSMGPFRALVADKLPAEQIATGYSLQSFMIGIGGALGFLIAGTNWLKDIPFLKTLGGTSLHWQFYLCAAICLGAVLVTIFTTTEDPPLPEELEARNHKSTDASSMSAGRIWGAIKNAVAATPSGMRRLCLVQFATWTGLFCFWIYYSIAVAHHIYGATDPHSHAYQLGVQAANQSMSIYQFVSTGFALCIPWLARRIGQVWTHCLGLLCAGAGLLMVSLIKNPDVLVPAMFAVGIGWGTVLTMPFAILVEHIPPQRYGVLMGIFNLFVVLPEILASLVLGPMVKHVFGGNEMLAIAMGGCFILLGALLMTSLRRLDQKPKPDNATALPAHQSPAPTKPGLSAHGEPMLLGEIHETLGLPEIGPSSVDTVTVY